MKKIHLIFAVFSVSFAFAQTDLTGINTYNPKGILHVDGQGDNSAVPTEAEALNDFIVLPNGNVGVGTITPTNKLSIKTNGTTATPIPGLKIQDGSQGVNKVLKSDANGVASWGGLNITSASVITGAISSQSNHLNNLNNNTIGSITIPPGLYFVKVNVEAYLSAGQRGNATLKITQNNIGWNSTTQPTLLPGTAAVVKLFTSDERNTFQQDFFFYNSTNQNVVLYAVLSTTSPNLYIQDKSVFLATPISVN